MSCSTSRSRARPRPGGRTRAGRLARPAALLASVALVAGCSGRPDGVLSLAFALAPPAVVTLPEPGELGSTFSPISLAQATGKLVATPPDGSAELTVESLPPLGVPKDVATYRFTLTFGPKPVPPQSAVLRLLRAASPVGAAWAETGAEDRLVKELTPDAMGRVRLALYGLEGADRVTGGRIDIVLPTAAGGERTFKVLEGRVGNLAGASGSATPPAPKGGGHEH